MQASSIKNNSKKCYVITIITTLRLCDQKNQSLFMVTQTKIHINVQIFQLHGFLMHEVPLSSHHQRFIIHTILFYFCLQQTSGFMHELTIGGYTSFISMTIEHWLKLYKCGLKLLKIDIILLHDVSVNWSTYVWYSKSQQEKP